MIAKSCFLSLNFNHAVFGFCMLIAFGPSLRIADVATLNPLSVRLDASGAEYQVKKDDSSCSGNNDANSPDETGKNDSDRNMDVNADSDVDPTANANIKTTGTQSV